MSITSLFQTAHSIITSASAGQVAVGKNIAGMNDPNYHRVNTSLIAKNNGVTARFTRAYNKYTERSFIIESTSQHRWTMQNELLSNLQSVFNESGEKEGIGKTLTKFFASWSGLSSNPSNTGSKVEVVEIGKTISQLLHNTHQTIVKEEQDSIVKIKEQVAKVNALISDIASVNKLISNPQTADFALLDRRDALARELSEYIDVNIVNDTEGAFTLTTKSGYTLVNGETAYSLELHENMVTSDLKPNSPFIGSMHFTGSSSYEYKVEMVTTGAIGVAEFRVSIDGGKTWLTNPATGGNTFVSSADPNQPTQIGDLSLWFDAGDVVAGDSFTAVPKLGLFWKTTTSSLVNITPQQYTDSIENTSRLVGGTLGGLFTFKDSHASKYKEQLSTFAKELIWNVNKAYSQGAGTILSTASGVEKVTNTQTPLSQANSGLAFGDRITAGTFTIYEYNTNGDKEARVITLDPTVDSLESIRDSINAACQSTTARISPEGRLELIPKGTQAKGFAFGEDTTGVLAALGINTFFTGSDAHNISVNPELVKNPSLVHTGRVLADGTIAVGDNSIALQIAGLQNDKITITDRFNNKTESSLFEYYTSLSTKVGSDISSSAFNADYYKAQAGFWYAKGSSEYGVSEEEELTYSMQLQDLYRTGAKMIETARTMLDSLLSII